MRCVGEGLKLIQRHDRGPDHVAKLNEQRQLLAIKDVTDIPEDKTADNTCGTDGAMLH